MKITKWLLTVILVTASVDVQAQGFEMTAEQQEVWDRVVECHSAWAYEDDRATSEGCFHDDYTFWWAGNLLPFTKDALHLYWSRLRGTEQTIAVEYYPARVYVHGDLAIVHWGGQGFTRDAAGNPDRWGERVSMTMIRENGQWMFLGGGGSPYEP